MSHADHHHHDHRGPGDQARPEAFDQSFWDERYRSRPALWSGNPNPHLLTEVAGLAAGRALDVGCGEGADALWLAARGWQVTGVDFSEVALERAAGHAAAAGPEIASRIEWLHQDLTAWGPPAAGYDLVSAHYLHLPVEPRQALFRRLADGVADGGTLLFAAHHPSDMQTTMPRPPIPDLYFTGDEIAAWLDPARWEVVVNDARPRSATDPEGRTVTIHDTVFRARQRAGS
jgi:SAM-dependent methyltransferase